MIKFLLFLAIGALVCTAGCTDREDGERDPAYAAAPTSTEDEGEDASEMAKYPGIVMIHSFNGLEPGYLDLADELASEGYV